MRIKFENIKENPVTLLRRAGYVFQKKAGQEMSFVRSLARSGFPRFHIYANVSENDLFVSIHLDQKRETYGKATRHHGEYEDEGVLKAEIERIQKILK